MGGKTNAFETSLLQLIFNGTAIVGIAQNHSSPYADLYVSLHVADPAEGGNQAASEAAYTNYGRIAVSRNAAGWVIAGNQVSNNGVINFNQCGATGNNIVAIGVGTNATGAGNLLYYGNLTGNNTLVVSNGVTPSFAANALVITEE